LHAKLSSQSVPFGRGVNVAQFPSAPEVLHDAMLHWSLNGVQFCAAPPVQTPAWHVSPTLHAKLSSQSVPFGRGVTVAQFPSAPAVLHDATLHWSPNGVQFCAAPPVQTPA